MRRCNEQQHGGSGNFAAENNTLADKKKIVDTLNARKPRIELRYADETVLWEISALMSYAIEGGKVVAGAEPAITGMDAAIEYALLLISRKKKPKLKRCKLKDCRWLFLAGTGRKSYCPDAHAKEGEKLRPR